MKFCKDCKHMVPDMRWSEALESHRVLYAGCAKATVTQPHPVTGEPVVLKEMRCEAMRQRPTWAATLFGECGRGGRYWEAK